MSEKFKKKLTKLEKKLKKNGSEASNIVLRRLYQISGQQAQAKKQIENIAKVLTQRNKGIELLGQSSALFSLRVPDFVNDSGLSEFESIVESKNIRAEIDKQLEPLLKKEKKLKKKLTLGLRLGASLSFSVKGMMLTQDLQKVQEDIKKNKQTREALEKYFSQQRLLKYYMTESKRLMTGDSTLVLEKDIEPEDFLKELIEFEKSKKAQISELMEKVEQSSIEDIAVELKKDARSQVEDIQSAVAVTPTKSVFSGVAADVVASEPIEGVFSGAAADVVATDAITTEQQAKQEDARKFVKGFVRNQEALQDITSPFPEADSVVAKDKSSDAQVFGGAAAVGDGEYTTYEGNPNVVSTKSDEASGIFSGAKAELSSSSEKVKGTEDETLKEKIELDNLLNYYNGKEFDEDTKLPFGSEAFKANYDERLTDNQVLKQFAKDKLRFLLYLKSLKQSKTPDEIAISLRESGQLSRFHQTAKNIAVIHFDKALIEIDKYLSVSKKSAYSNSDKDQIIQKKNEIITELRNDLLELKKNINASKSEYEVDKLIREFSDKAMKNKGKLRAAHDQIGFIGLFSRKKSESSAMYIFRDLEHVSLHTLCDEQRKLQIKQDEKFSFASDNMLNNTYKILKNAFFQSQEYLAYRKLKVGDRKGTDKKFDFMVDYFDKMSSLYLKVQDAKEGKKTLSDEELVDILKEVDRINTRYSSKFKIRKREKKKWFSSSASNIFSQTSKELNKMKVEKQESEIISTNSPKAF